MGIWTQRQGSRDQSDADTSYGALGLPEASKEPSESLEGSVYLQHLEAELLTSRPMSI